MADRPKPSYALKVLKDLELPPEPKVTRSAESHYAQVLINLEKLMAKPERWGEIAVYHAKPGSEKNPSGARKVAQKLLSGEVALPTTDDGWGFDIEWRSATYDGSDREGSVVLARYSPDEEPEEPETADEE